MSRGYVMCVCRTEWARSCDICSPADEQRFRGLPPAPSNLLISYRAPIRSWVFCLSLFPFHVAKCVCLVLKESFSRNTTLPSSRNTVVTWQAGLPGWPFSCFLRSWSLIIFFFPRGSSNKSCTKNNAWTATFCLVGSFPRMTQCNESSL